MTILSIALTVFLSYSLIISQNKNDQKELSISESQEEIKTLENKLTRSQKETKQLKANLIQSEKELSLQDEKNSLLVSEKEKLSQKKPQAKKQEKVNEKNTSNQNKVIKKVTQQVYKKLYTDFFKAKDISPDLQEKVSSILAENAPKNSDLYFMLYDEETSDDDILASQAALENELKKDLKKVLSEQDYESLKEHKNSIPQKQIEKQLLTKLKPLQLAQEEEEEIVHIFIEADKKLNPQNYDTNINRGNIAKLRNISTNLAATFDEKIKNTKKFYKLVLEKTRDNLSSEQHNKLDQAQKQDIKYLEMTKANLPKEGTS